MNKLAITLAVIPVIGVVLAALIGLIPSCSQKSPTTGQPTITTHGNNSPVISQGGSGNQSVVAGNNATVNQAGRDIVINPPPLREAADSNDLERRYAKGFVLIRADKPDRFETYESGVSCNLDMQQTRIVAMPSQHLFVRLRFAALVISNATMFGHMTMPVEFVMTNAISARCEPLRGVYHQPHASMHFQILDNHPRRPIYVLGFGPPEPWQLKR